MEIVPVRCRIPELLKKIGRDQQWLADTSGLSKQQISNYCTLLKIMNLRTAAKVAHYLHCKIDDLYVWELQLK